MRLFTMTGLGEKMIFEDLKQYVTPHSSVENLSYLGETHQ